jgi:hypothetical protein
MPKQKDLRKAAGMPSTAKVKPIVKAPKGYRHVERPGISKWEDGLEVQGTLMGVREVRPNNFLVDFKIEGSRQTFGCPTILRDILRDVEEEAALIVRCKGKITTGTGQEAWDFDVFAEGESEAF